MYCKYTLCISGDSLMVSAVHDNNLSHGGIYVIKLEAEACNGGNHWIWEMTATYVSVINSLFFFYRTLLCARVSYCPREEMFLKTEFFRISFLSLFHEGGFVKRLWIIDNSDNKRIGLDGSCSYKCTTHLCFIDFWAQCAFFWKAKQQFVSIVTLICAPPSCTPCAIYILELCHKYSFITVVNLNQSSLCLLSLQVCDIKDLF